MPSFERKGLQEGMMCPTIRCDPRIFRRVNGKRLHCLREAELRVPTHVLDL